MSGKGFAAVQKSFVAETVGAFEFLATEFGLTGPELEDAVLPVVGFIGRDVGYRIALDVDDMIVMTRVEYDLGVKRLVAELEDLVQAAGLGARNHVVQRVPTLRGLRHALQSQAGYVRQLQPRMASGGVVELMRAANAREWKIR